MAAIPTAVPSEIKRVFQQEAGKYVFMVYPEPTSAELRGRLVDLWNSHEVKISPDNIVVSDGDMGILERFNKMFLYPGASVVGYKLQ